MMNLSIPKQVQVGLISKRDIEVGRHMAVKWVTHLVILFLMLRPAYMIWVIAVYQVDTQ